jgi:hypothetical protein
MVSFDRGHTAPHFLLIHDCCSAVSFLRSLAAGSEIPISDLSHRATVFEVTPMASARAACVSPSFCLIAYSSLPVIDYTQRIVEVEMQIKREAFRFSTGLEGDQRANDRRVHEQLLHTRRNMPA